MNSSQLQAGRILGYSGADCPLKLKARFPLPDLTRERIEACREQVLAIVQGYDTRLLVIAGPCSIHDAPAAARIAEELSSIAARIESKILLLMRFYVEKPRSSIGWKGHEIDPDLDGSCDIAAGRRKTRALAVDLASRMGLAGELLNLAGTATYLDDIYAWGAIGARTCSSQPHREMVSGLPFAGGFKNDTSGELAGAIGGVVASSRPQTYLATGPEGSLVAVRTTGNPATHLVLRGGGGRTNYDAQSRQTACAALGKAGLPARVMVDCSHGNAQGQGANQSRVFRDCIRQIAEDEAGDLIGLMLESNIYPGKQPLAGNPSDLRYGVSITDECIGMSETEDLLLEAYDKLPQRTTAAASVA